MPKSGTNGSETFLSTPSARRATALLMQTGVKRVISIHALREEGDHQPIAVARLYDISIHALREEGDGSGAMRGGIRLYFYPRPPRGGRPIDQQAEIDSYLISIHALREEGDLMMLCSSVSAILFLSTPSARRATRPRSFPKKVYSISIHALREEGDTTHEGIRYDLADFYPRPPRGGRLPILRACLVRCLFLSTPSARRATIKDLGLQVDACISIHALREEGDRNVKGGAGGVLLFLSTPSARRATLILLWITC